MTRWPTARQHMKKDVVWNVTDQSSQLERELATNPSRPKVKDDFTYLAKTKMLGGICVGYVPRAGGGWSGDLIMADVEDLQNMPASEICVKRFEHQASR